MKVIEFLHYLPFENTKNLVKIKLRKKMFILTLMRLAYHFKDLSIYSKQAIQPSIQHNTINNFLYPITTDLWINKIPHQTLNYNKIVLHTTRIKQLPIMFQTCNYTYQIFVRLIKNLKLEPIYTTRGHIYHQGAYSTNSNQSSQFFHR